MLENIKGLEFSHPRLKICSDLPGIDSLLSSIRADRSGGEPLRQNISAVAEIMGRDWVSENYPGRAGTIIGIPRSGVPMGNGLNAVFPGYDYLLSNDGGNRDEGQPILPNNLSINGPNLLVTDSVIVTGRTVALTLSAALSKASSLERVTVFAAFASAGGLINLLKIFPELEINIGSIARTKQHWDVHRWKSSLTLEGIPNLGELVSRP